MYWLEVSVVTDGEGAEALSETLRPYAYDSSVVLEQLGDPSSADPLALQPQITVKIFIPGDEDSPVKRQRIQEALYYLGRLYPIPAPTFRELVEEEWASAWRRNYHPFRVGKRLQIRPSWERIEEGDVDDIVVTLDPGMAFGTGLHPSTQMCLGALDELMQVGYRVLDIGTGSGILAIAAAKLGGAEVLAFDIDRVAAKVALSNAQLNEVQDKISVFQGTLAAIGRRSWDLVLVNILAPVIISLLVEDRLLDYVTNSGRVVLGGIVEDQVFQVEETVLGVGGSVHRRVTLNDWATVIAGN